MMRGARHERGKMTTNANAQTRAVSSAVACASMRGALGRGGAGCGGRQVTVAVRRSAVRPRDEDEDEDEEDDDEGDDVHADDCGIETSSDDAAFADAGSDMTKRRDDAGAMESGWTRPARKGGAAAGASGSYSAETNADGVHVCGFGARVCSLDQWANVPEDDDDGARGSKQRRRFDVNAARATTIRELEARVMRECGANAWVTTPGAMRAFLNAQFLRSVEQGKLVQCFTSTGEAAWATFHTNLLSNDEFPIFAVFFREFAERDGGNSSERMMNTAASTTTAKTNAGVVERPTWELCGFVDDIALRDPSQAWNQIEPILHIPPRATFVDDPHDYLWLANDRDFEEVVLEIDARFWPSVDARADVFPQELASDPAARQRAASAAVPRAARLVLYGYYVPVLRYARLEGQRAPGTVQMLLPLELERDYDADDVNDDDDDTTLICGAIVVDIVKSRRGGRMYRAVGIISTREAALTARVIGPITAEWLRSAANVHRRRRCERRATADDMMPTTCIDVVPFPDASPVSVIERITSPKAVEDVTKPAYAAVANTPAKILKFASAAAAPMTPSTTPLMTSTTMTSTTTRCIVTNPKVNLKMLPFEFMQAVTRKLNVDEDVLRLSDAPTNAEFRVIQSISVEASAWLRSIMSAYGVVDRAYVGVSRRVRCFFAVVSFEKWHDLATRDAMVRGEHVVVKEFKCRDRVYMRISLEDKQTLGL